MNYEVYIEENDPVILLSDTVNEMYQTTDFTKYTKEEYSGKIPEDIMMKVLIYGYMCGAYSSRKIETCCHRDINFLYLPETYAAPDHSTIARFRKSMPKTIKTIFYKIVEKLLEKGEISGKNIFIDGTKIEANANRYTFVWKNAVTKNEMKLRAKLPVILAELKEHEKIVFPENTEVDVMIATLEKLMKDLNIEFVSGKGKHKTPIQRSLEKLLEYRERLSSLKNKLCK